MKQSEKLYRQKSEALTRQKAPLEAANDQIAALNLKIQRRDTVISDLRKSLALEIMLVVNHYLNTS